jgi:hypothetical protein
MAFFLTDTIFNGLIRGGWTGLKNAGRGMRGKYIRRDAETGLEYSVSPFRDGLLGDVKRHSKKVLTGRNYDDAGNIIDEGNFITNRVEGALGLAADFAIGMPMQAIGWGIGKTASVAGRTAMWAAPKIARQVGRSTKEAFDLFGDTAINAAEFIVELGKTKRGQMMLFSAPILAMGAAPVIAEGFSDNGTRALKEGLAAKVGGTMDTMMGTTMELSGSQYTIDNMNADGDLVFALHNLR